MTTTQKAFIIHFTPLPNMDSNSLDSGRAQNTDSGLFSLPEELIVDIGEFVLATGRTEDGKAMRDTCRTLRRVVPDDLGGVVSEAEVLLRNQSSDGGSEPWTSVVALNGERSQLDDPSLGGCKSLKDLSQLLPKMDTWTNLTIGYGDTYPCRRVTGALRPRPDGGSTLRIQWPYLITSTTGRNYTLTNAPFASSQDFDLEVAVKTLHLMPFRQSGSASTIASEYHTQTLPIPENIELGVPIFDTAADTTALVASVDSLLTSLHEQHGPLKMGSLQVYLGRDASAPQYRQVIDIASASGHTFDEVRLGTMHGRGPSLCCLVTDKSLLNGMPPGNFTFRVDDAEGLGFSEMAGGCPEPEIGTTPLPVSQPSTCVTFKLAKGRLADPDKLGSGLKVHAEDTAFRFTKGDGSPLKAYDALIRRKMECVSEPASTSQTS